VTADAIRVKLERAKASRERVYQKWLRGDVYTSQLKGWDDYIGQLERELKEEATRSASPSDSGSARTTEER
jgi:hypothetical protein